MRLGVSGAGCRRIVRLVLRCELPWCGCAVGPAACSRPYFENCTVDASIFVAKLLRAHGGCLGIRSR